MILQSRPLVAVVLLTTLAACSRESKSQRVEAEVQLPPGAVPIETSAPADTVRPPEPSAVEQQPSCSCTGTPVSFATLAKKADPSVVTILSRIEERSRTGRRRLVGEGLGTGFVYDRSGLILTNHHVIEDSTEVSAKFANGREVVASIVGRDKRTDVAVLRVDEANLVPLPLGDSDAIDVGDWVVAIGNPFGLSHTVSAGILSAKGRTHDDVKGLDPAGYFNFLQTDAAINQGNSGGPLLNMGGEVVGINAAIRANANSIGFAIPINMVKQLLPILVRDGKVTRSALGIIVEALNEAESVRLKRPDRKGAWIKMVLPGSGADRAGLSVDDVIVEFDGRPIADPNELRWLASIAGVGKSVTMRIQRGDRIFDLRVTLGPLRDPAEEGDFGFPFRR